MKNVYTFLLVLGLGLVDGAAVKDKLPAPEVKKITTFDPAGIRLQWELLDGKKGDPIIGYRMKVWELSRKVYSFENDENGDNKLVEKIKPIENTSSFDYKNAQPKWIVDVGPEDNEAEVNGVTYDITYELRVQALTKNEEGPFSEKTLVVIHSY